MDLVKRADFEGSEVARRLLQYYYVKSAIFCFKRDLKGFSEFNELKKLNEGDLGILSSQI